MFNNLGDIHDMLAKALALKGRIALLRQQDLDDDAREQELDEINAGLENLYAKVDDIAELEDLNAMADDILRRLSA